MVSELLLKGTHNGVVCEMYAVLYVLSCTTIIIEDQYIDHLDHNACALLSYNSSIEMLVIVTYIKLY